MVNQRSIGFGWIVSVLLLTIAAPGAVTAEEARSGGPLDGLAFVGETGMDGKDHGRSDQFVFAGGKFRASSFADYGFSDATYETTEVDGELRFSVAVVSSRSSGGRMLWTGTLRGDALEGTMRWDHGWESRRFWFRARTRSPTTAGL